MISEKEALTEWQKNPTHENLKIWKIAKDSQYALLWDKTKNFAELEAAGFFIDTNQPSAYTENLDLICTPTNKLIIDKQAVLLTTGSFSPIHNGHIQMMESAKQALEKAGITVAGGYISPSHDQYVSTKRSKKESLEGPYRVSLCQEAVKDSPWLMVDPWEALWTPAALNFTDVIKRLKNYLKKYYADFIIYYVFGEDNIAFKNVFADDKYVCVQRPDEVKSSLNNIGKISNVALVNNLTNNDSSTKIWVDPEKVPKCIKTEFLNMLKPPRKNFIYVLRDDLQWAAQDMPITTEELNTFKKALIKSIKTSFVPGFRDPKYNMHFEVISFQQAREVFEKLTKPIISMDVVFKGCYSIGTSRVFELSESQYEAAYSTIRLEQANAKQFSQIPEGIYTLFDDDISTGGSMDWVCKQLPEKATISQVKTLMGELVSHFDDVVDLRDFLLGGKSSGLTVKKDNTLLRAPYLLPYVNLNKRASMHLSTQQKFSAQVWKLNAELHKNSNFTIKDGGEALVLLAKLAGWKKTALLTDYCNWHHELILSVMPK